MNARLDYVFPEPVASASQWMELVRRAPAAIAMFDRDMRYLFASQRYLEDYRLPYNDLVGRVHYDVFPDVPRHWKDIHQRCLAGATERAESEPFARADGTVDWVNWEIYPWTEPSGDIGGLILHSEVVTERRGLQDALTRTDEFYRTILEDVPGLICRYRPDGVITYVNQKYCEYFGKQREEIIGNTILHRIAVDDRDRVSSAIRKLGEGASAVTVQHRVPFPSGETRWQEWVDRRIGDEDGNFVEIQSTGRDITEQKQAEDRLRLADLIIQRSPAVVFRWKVAPDWPVQYVSDNVSQWGYTAEELLNGRSPSCSLLTPDELARISEELVNKVPAGVENVPLRYRLRTRQGEERWVEAYIRVERDAEDQPEFIQGVVSDITARRRQEEASKARTRRTVAAGEALSGLAMSETLAQGEVELFACELTEQAARATGVARASVWLFDESETRLRCIDLYEAMHGRHTAGMVFSEAHYGPEFRALKSAPYIDASDALTDARTSGYRDVYTRPLGITSMLDTVVKVAGRCLGVVCLEHVHHPHEWQPDEIEFACRLGDKIGLALSNRHARMARDRWMAGLEQTVRAISNTVEIRDPYTAGHQERVAQLCEAIGHELGLPADRIRGLSFAAIVHDVGKARVPADILNKPCGLTFHELQFVRTHSEAGYDILKNVEFPWPIAEIVLQHHERLDGSGYPRGLRGEEILLEARILAVADVVEAMAAHRPYRAAHGIEAALAEIENHAGVWYDENVVQACLRVFRRERFSWDSH